MSSLQSRHSSKIKSIFDIVTLTLESGCGGLRGREGGGRFGRVSYLFPISWMYSYVVSNVCYLCKHCVIIGVTHYYYF